MSRKVRIGNLFIGGGEKIAVQSMTNTRTRDTEATSVQIKRLEEAGCDIVRCAVRNEEDAEAFETLVGITKMPLVADIHFDYRLAIAAMENGAAKVRVNPGNLGEIENFGKVLDCAEANGCAVRIGVNGGSVNKSDRAETSDKEEAMLRSVERYVKYAEGRGFYDLVLAAKSSSVRATVSMGRKLSERFDYPLHIGVTEAGVYETSLVRSAVGIGSLLLDGIGDTIRVSATGDPVPEVRAARLILESLGLIRCTEVVSCPTCGRCGIDLAAIAEKVNAHVEGWTIPIKIAVMGCVVNGPGEAEDADIGLAGGEGCAAVFRKGVPCGRIEGDIAENFLKLLDDYAEENFGKR